MEPEKVVRRKRYKAVIPPQMTLPTNLRKGTNNPARYGTPPEPPPENNLYYEGGIPLNRTAMLVTLPDADPYTPDKKLAMPHWQVPPEMVDLDAIKYWGPGNDKPKNWAGTKIGRLTVVGYWGAGKRYKGSGMKHGTERHKWVVRCACGIYTIRTAKTIKKAVERGQAWDMCEFCKHQERLKRNDIWHRTGKHMDREFTPTKEKHHG
jgi:hypothetical protein